MIERFEENPLIVPDPKVPWMTENVFNPGVIKDGEIFYMLARGCNNIVRRQLTQAYSDLGFITSCDGINWDPPKLYPSLSHLDYNLATERGIEDPRIVKWNNIFYIFATASYKHYGRIGIWKTADFSFYDFLGHPFDWEDKDACIIPEFINDKIFLIHRMNPNIWMSSSNNMELTGPWGDSKVLLHVNDVTLDGGKPIKIGLDGPPMELEGSWFVMFHAKFEPFEYRNSFMILDGSDPRKVKYVHSESILKPELYCEKFGAVPYVCFSNAIVDLGDMWYVYWGAADTSICGGSLRKQDVLEVLSKENV